MKKLMLVATGLLTLVGGVAAGRVFGDVVRFTGTGALDLSVSSNWEGGALPGEDDVAVVDFAGRDAEATFLTDLSFGGLVLTNLGANATLAGGSEAPWRTLTLGAAGLVSHRASGAQGGLTVNANLATAAEQSWRLPMDQVSFNGTITGSELLTIVNNKSFMHRVAPGYGGKIVYTYDASDPVNANHILGIQQKGVWANDIECDRGRLEFGFQGSVSWQELFPGRTMQSTGTMLLTQPGQPQIDFADGDGITGSPNELFVEWGLFNQTGGSVSSSVQIGSYWYPALYDMSGGTLDTDRILIGNQTTSAWYTNQMFRLRGGEVTAGGVFLGWMANYNSIQTAHTDFLVEGGTLQLEDSTDRDSGIHFGYSKQSSGMPSRAATGTMGEFRITGGTVKTPQIALGSHVDNDARCCGMLTNAYFTLRMDGGTLDVGSLGFCQLRDRWNVRETGVESVDSHYLLSMRGGTLAAHAPFISELDMTFPSNDVPFTINTREHDVTLAAPLSGKGAIDKTGSGSLVIADGTLLTGALRIREGAVKVLGSEISEDVEDDKNCVIWRADELANGLEDGDGIDAWPTVDNSRSAVYDEAWNNPSGTWNNSAVVRPTLALNAFNGHAGVAFEKSALKVSAADSPIAGATNWTICVVFKTETPGLDWGGNNWYNARGIVGGEDPGCQNDWGLVFCESCYVGGGMGVAEAGSDTCLYVTARKCADNRAHVAFYSLDCSGRRTVQVDELEAYDFVPLAETGKSPRNSSDFYMGLTSFGGWNPHDSAFVGTVAEIRFYPDKALTSAERLRLGTVLAEKYGAMGAASDDGAASTTMPEGGIAWDADDLDALADGSAVEAWPSADGEKTADLATGRICYRYSATGALDYDLRDEIEAPTLARNAINGHHAVRFNGVNQTLGVPALDSPVCGQTKWTAAMVFRTTDTRGTSENRQFYEGCGLFGAEVPSARADWGISFWNERGRVIAGYGDSLGDSSAAGRPVELNDGEPHSVIVVYDMDAGSACIVVDGVPCVTVARQSTPREALRICLGAINATDPFFAGDIAAFRLYGRALASDEIEALAEDWRKRYGIVEQPKVAHAAGASGRYGLGSKSITVDADAELELPMDEAAPFTLADGQTLVCAGQVKGLLAVGDGGMLDCASATPKSIDGLWLRDGATLAVSRMGEPITLTSFKAEDALTVVVDGEGPLPARIPLFAYSDTASVSDVSVKVVGIKYAVTLKVSNAMRQVLLCPRNGLSIILR